jgi:hypothetical protein
LSTSLVRGNTALTSAVSALCRELETSAPDDLAPAIRAIKHQLSEPLRVAVGGRVSAGKSTLVNALLGRRIAEVRAEETRRLTTVYRAAASGEPEQVSLLLRDGTRLPMAFTADGGLPHCDRPDARRWEVSLHAPALTRLTLVDTPGLFSGSVGAGFSEAGEHALLGDHDRDAMNLETRDAMREADALIYLLGDAVSSVDLTMLRRYGAQLAEWGKSGFNAVALIGRADEVRARGKDPMEGAAEQAAAARAALGAAVAGVVPVSSLLAETARTGALSDDELTVLAELADHPPSDRVLDNPTVLEATPGMAPLVALLGSYGIRVTLRHIRENGPARAGVQKALERRSGLADVIALLRRQFLVHADIIKAAGALGELQSLSERIDGGAARILAEEIARVRRRPEFHRVNEVLLYQDVVLGVLPLGKGWKAEVSPLLALHDVHERLCLPPSAGHAEIAAAVRGARLRWARLRDDQLQPLRVRRAAPIMLETLRRLQDDIGTPARRRSRPTSGRGNEALR